MALKSKTIVEECLHSLTIFRIAAVTLTVTTIRRLWSQPDLFVFWFCYSLGNY